jgi:hypothetical protein
MFPAPGSIEDKPVVTKQEPYRTRSVEPGPISKWFVMWAILIPLVVVFIVLFYRNWPPSPNPRDAIREAVKEVVTDTVNRIPKQCLKVGDKLSEEEVNYLNSNAFEKLNVLKKSSELPASSDKPPIRKKPDCSPLSGDPPSDKPKNYSIELPCKLTFKRSLPLPSGGELSIDSLDYCIGIAGPLYLAIKTCPIEVYNIFNTIKCIIDHIMTNDKTEEAIKDAKIIFI